MKLTYLNKKYFIIFSVVFCLLMFVSFSKTAKATEESGFGDNGGFSPPEGSYTTSVETFAPGFQAFRATLNTFTNFQGTQVNLDASSWTICFLTSGSPVCFSGTGWDGNATLDDQATDAAWGIQGSGSASCADCTFPTDGNGDPWGVTGYSLNGTLARQVSIDTFSSDKYTVAVGENFTIDWATNWATIAGFPLFEVVSGPVSCTGGNTQNLDQGTSRLNSVVNESGSIICTSTDVGDITLRLTAKGPGPGSQTVQVVTIVISSGGSGTGGGGTGGTLSCSPSNQTVYRRDWVTFTASGGTGSYSWSAPGADPFATGVGGGSNNADLNTQYANIGSYTATVTSGSNTASCDVDVIDGTNPTPPPPPPQPPPSPSPTPPPPPPGCTPAGLQASFINQSIDGVTYNTSQSVTFSPGSTHEVKITMGNSSCDSYWLGENGPALERLGSLFPATWGIGGPEACTTTRVCFTTFVAANVGDTHVFTFDITMPASGSYDFQWQMVCDGGAGPCGSVNWFGDRTPNITFISASPTLYVGVNASPNTGTAPLNSTITATVSGSAPGPYTYNFYCDVASGSPPQFTTTISGKTASYVCTYPTAGTYTTEVDVSANGLVGSDSKPVTVNTGTVIVSITATPNTGTVPFSSTVVATVTTTIVGPTTYNFYCYLSGSNTVTYTTTLTSDTASYDCPYSTAGNYTVEVDAIRGGQIGSDSKPITANGTGFANVFANVPTNYRFSETSGAFGPIDVTNSESQTFTPPLGTYKLTNMRPTDISQPYIDPPIITDGPVVGGICTGNVVSDTQTISAVGQTINFCIDFMYKPNGGGFDNSGCKTVTINWNDIDSGQNRFEIYRSDAGANTWTPLNTNLSYAARSYTDNNATAGNSYDYKVVAVSALGQTAELIISNVPVLTCFASLSQSSKTISRVDYFSPFGSLANGNSENYDPSKPIADNTLVEFTITIKNAANATDSGLLSSISPETFTNLKCPCNVDWSRGGASKPFISGSAPNLVINFPANTTIAPGTQFTVTLTAYTNLGTNAVLFQNQAIVQCTNVTDGVDCDSPKLTATHLFSSTGSNNPQFRETAP